MAAISLCFMLPFFSSFVFSPQTRLGNWNADRWLPHTTVSP